ncbi:uncharacterized protein FA14DRAFT_155748 [Meira miltonrushii]|uniref:Uncharacterized protein n=1 Tax=Meira miltonrushii TaxID=1280837 RepID=A0A316VJ66_9BASI|nr:uncharacterized protein FA14DRAFT_155748 [Meira miltonrushii]PWN36343.1 hypothetical protein FA14DRAFT_155748 [Meira miltonrushii]
MRLLNLASRNATMASRSATFSARQTRLATSNLHSSAIRFREPTQSEESVKAEKHNHSPEELQKQTAKKSTDQFKEENHFPTASEEAAKADVANHDPLPDHKKKKSSSKP